MKPFFLSIITALTTGLIVAIFGIIVIHRANNPQIATASQREESVPEPTDEEDPTFISILHFSRGYVYSADLTRQPLEDDTVLSSLHLKPISASAYRVTDISRGTILVEKDPDRLLPIASVTKLVTAVIAKKLYDEDDLIKITPQAFSVEGTTGKFVTGESLKVKEILYPLLMVSSNDAAEALALHYGRTKFIHEMNTWASSIGAYRTYFKDPTGLSPLNVSTANDITLITTWIHEHEPELLNITLTKSKTIRRHTWINPTHFLNLSSYLGGKNGYTTEAQRTSTSLFSFGTPKRTYSVVLLGSKERDNDTLALLNMALK